MKGLLLDINVLHHNPTQQYMINFLNTTFDELVIYGPGFVSTEELEAGIEKFVYNNNFDFIIDNGFFTFLSLKEKKGVLLDVNVNSFKNYLFKFFKNYKNLEQYLRDMYEFYKNTKEKKLYFAPTMDTYGLKKEKIKILKEKNIFIMAPGEGFTQEAENMPFMKYDACFEVKKDSILESNWYHFVNEYPEKIINLGHYVDMSEFFYSPLEDRKYISSVPGFHYYRRKKAFKELKKHNIKMHSNIQKVIYAILNKLKIPVFSSYLGIKFYNIIFQNILFETKYIYTDGAGDDFPIRKFLEVPASGSILLASEFIGMKRWGFKDGENYISTTPENIIEKIAYLENNRKEAQKIAIKGRDLIWEKHSLIARSKQLRETLEEIKNQSYKKSYWKDGEYIIEKE